MRRIKYIETIEAHYIFLRYKIIYSKRQKEKVYVLLFLPQKI